MLVSARLQGETCACPRTSSAATETKRCSSPDSFAWMTEDETPRPGTGQTPEEILQGAWARVERVEPPSGEPPPGTEWRFAIGADWALGCAGLVTDEQIRRWEAHARAEAKR